MTRTADYIAIAIPNRRWLWPAKRGGRNENE